MGRFFGPTSTSISSAGYFRGSAASFPPLVWTARNSNLPGVNLEQLVFGTATQAVCSAALQSNVTVTNDTGSTWTAENITTVTGGLPEISYGSGKYLVTNVNGLVLPSTDGGVTWGLGVPTLSNQAAIAFLNGVWLVLSRNAGPGNYSISTDGGNTWAAQTAFTNNGWRVLGLITDGTQFIAVGKQAVTNNPTINTSTDGIHWIETVFSGLVNIPQACAFNGSNKYVIGSQDSTAVRVASTPAGLATAPDIPLSFTTGDVAIVCVAASPALMVACGNQSSVMVSHDNGVNWIQETLSMTTFASWVANSGNTFVACNGNGEISTRP